MNTLKSNKSLNPLQIELLKQFSYGLNKQDDLIAIKRLIADYLSKNIKADVDRFWADNNLDESILDEWIKEDS